MMTPGELIIIAQCSVIIVLLVIILSKLVWGK